MPIVVQIDPAVKVIVSTFTGEINENDFRTAVAELPKRSGFDPTFSHIIDFSGVTAANISSEFVRNFARGPSAFSLNAAQIVVAPQNHIFGLVRMAQILRAPESGVFEVVHSLAEAWEILPINHPIDREP